MSVIKFTADELQKIESMILGSNELLSVIARHEGFIVRFHYEKQFKKDLDVEVFSKQYLGRFIWYLYVANVVACSLSYEQSANFFEEKGKWNEVTPRSATFKVIESELNHLKFNILTSDGNRFISDEWYDLLDLLINRCIHGIAKPLINS